MENTPGICRVSFKIHQQRRIYILKIIPYYNNWIFNKHVERINFNRSSKFSGTHHFTYLVIYHHIKWIWYKLHMITTSQYNFHPKKYHTYETKKSRFRCLHPAREFAHKSSLEFAFSHTRRSNRSRIFHWKKSKPSSL